MIVCVCVCVYVCVWKRRACMSCCRRMIHLCICDLPDILHCFCSRLSSSRTSRSDIARHCCSPNHWSRRTAAGTSPPYKCTFSGSPSPRWQQTKQQKVKVKQERLICKRGLIDLKKISQSFLPRGTLGQLYQNLVALLDAKIVPHKGQ